MRLTSVVAALVLSGIAAPNEIFATDTPDLRVAWRAHLGAGLEVRDIAADWTWGREPYAAVGP